MTDAPERIWLQTAGEWAGASEVTWCEMPMNDGDHEYRRSDAPPTLAEAMTVPEVRALVAAAYELAFWLPDIIARDALGPSEQQCAEELCAILVKMKGPTPCLKRHWLNGWRGV
jgi:hypothetical protein